MRSRVEMDDQTRWPQSDGARAATARRAEMKMESHAVSRHALAFAFSALMGSALSMSAEARSYKWSCLFTHRAAPEGVKGDNFKFEFAFDDITGKAVIIGNMGVEDVEIHRGPFGVTFIEKLIVGVVQTTTVANDGTSVHSRHTVIGTKMVPSQYYGKCTQ